MVLHLHTSFAANTTNIKLARKVRTYVCGTLLQQYSLGYKSTTGGSLSSLFKCCLINERENLDQSLQPEVRHLVLNLAPPIGLNRMESQETCLLASGVEKN